MDEVSILDINVSKTSMKKVMFFIGVNEDKFPKKVDQDILFSDDELDILKENGAEKIFQEKITGTKRERIELK